MPEAYKLVGISGALRKASTNTLLMREAVRAFGPAEVVEGDLRLPLYDGDLEEAEGIPAGVTALAEALDAADGVIISTPEYNKALPGVLKNALDWMSRTKLKPFEGKPVAILSAAAGRAGGERAQYSLRHCLTAFNPRILQGPEVFIAASFKAFDDDGKLVDPKSFEFLGVLMAALKAEIDRNRAA